jgi:hypothetical protein
MQQDHRFELESPREVACHPNQAQLHWEFSKAVQLYQLLAILTGLKIPGHSVVLSTAAPRLIRTLQFHISRFATTSTNMQSL